MAVTAPLTRVGDSLNTTEIRQVSGEVWKWVAAVLAAFLLASVPGFIYALRTPTSAEVDIIRQRQVDVLVRLGVVEEQLRTNEQLIEQLRAALENHAENDRPR